MSKQSDTPTINQLLAQLDELVAWFNNDDVDIEEALGKYEAAVALADTIKTRLSEVDNKIIVLKKRFDLES